MTRDDILDAAADIFSTKGFDATSMQDIANAVNLQKASLYYHFSSKQDILYALLNQALSLLINSLEKVIDAPLSPEEKLRRAMVAYLEIIAGQQNLAAVLLLEHRSLDPDLRAKHIYQRDRFERIWRDLVLDGIQSGVFYCHDPSLVGRAILGILNWTVTWYRKEGPCSSEEIANHFSSLLLNGLLLRPRA